MEKELPKAYIPQEFEDNLYQKWIDSDYFNPDTCLKDGICTEDSEVFSVMMPPPNVTGILHLGHAFENTIMDIQTRYQRLLGKRTLWLPGTDHAAVATQAKVEKILIEEEGIADPREELGREKLLERIREFAEDSQKTIIGQIKKLGSSCDWSRLAFTFDDVRSKTVNEIFVKMYKDGLIYKGYRVVNWSVKGQSTCSDDELEYIPRTGKLYTFKYSKDFPISIATTRPETKLGDTAVAVHPEDDRYKQYIGQTFTVNVGSVKPLEIKIIADKHIDASYGTGALGVTPAHSIVDFEMYEKNDIELIQVVGIDGKMTKETGANYEGLTVDEARAKFVEWLKSEDLLESEVEIEQNVSISDRFKDIVEPIAMTQWFIDVNKEIPGKKGKTLKTLMQEVITIGHNGNTDEKITIMPERFNKTYFSWIDNLRDWCISRQIWWGHQIPVWTHNETGELHVSHEGPSDKENYTQDPDTLDTWFSSGTWTFSTLGWAGDSKETDDMKTYHPTTWMQMGWEILFFWMARMILMTTYALDEIPFKDVYIHGMLRDKEGKKFSKSAGNGIDPLEMIEKYGTDALRLSLIADVTSGQDSRFYEDKVEYFRNVVNKLWNISRFIMMSVEKVSYTPKLSNETSTENLSLSDKWILSELNTLTENTTDLLNKYQYSLALEGIRDFTWNKFADWYIEIAKIEKADSSKDEILNYILQSLLKLWHPYAPFITEHIWSFVEDKPRDLLMVDHWPTSDNIKSDSKDFDLVQDIVSGIRNARAEKKIEPAKKIEVSINAKSNEELLKSQEHVIKGLARLEAINYSKSKPEKALTIVVHDIEISLHLDSALDMEAEKIRIEKEIANIEKYISGIEKKLSNERFIENAKPEVVEQERDKLKAGQEKLEALKKQRI